MASTERILDVDLSLLGGSLVTLDLGIGNLEALRHVDLHNRFELHEVDRLLVVGIQIDTKAEFDTGLIEGGLNLPDLRANEAIRVQLDVDVEWLGSLRNVLVTCIVISGKELLGELSNATNGSGGKEPGGGAGEGGAIIKLLGTSVVKDRNLDELIDLAADVIVEVRRGSDTTRL